MEEKIIDPIIRKSKNKFITIAYFYKFVNTLRIEIL